MTSSTYLPFKFSYVYLYANLSTSYFLFYDIYFGTLYCM